MEAKKVYVKSGDLECVLMASGPRDAIKKAMGRHPVGRLHPHFVFIDERGFRENNAAYRVPVEQALTEAGYIHHEARPRHEDEDDLFPSNNCPC